MRLQQLLDEVQNPELDQNASAYDQLLPYKNDPDVYIKFSKSSRFGKVQKSNDDVPVGLYAYPLKQTWADFNVEKTKNFDNYPYANKRPYIHVFKYSFPITIIDSYKNIDRDAHVLKSRYSHLVNLDQELERLSYKKPFEQLWRLTKHIANELSPNNYKPHWTKILRALNYNGFKDKTGTAHKGDAAQVFLLKPESILLLDTIKNKDYKKLKTKTADINSIGDVIRELDNKSTKVRSVLLASDGDMHEQIQQHLETKADQNKLFNYLDGRSESDIKLLLLIWLNGVVDFRKLNTQLLDYKNTILTGTSEALVDYGKHMIKFKWNDDVLKHNIELFKSK